MGFVEVQMRVRGARLVRCLMKNDTTQDRIGAAQARCISPTRGFGALGTIYCTV